MILESIDENGLCLMKISLAANFPPFLPRRLLGTLHPISAPGYFILQTDDGSVVTVHDSQVNKTDSGLPRGRSYARVKLTTEDKKAFVENVSRHLLVYVNLCTDL